VITSGSTDPTEAHQFCISSLSVYTATTTAPVIADYVLGVNHFFAYVDVDDTGNLNDRIFVGQRKVTLASLAFDICGHDAKGCNEDSAHTSFARRAISCRSSAVG